MNRIQSHLAQRQRVVFSSPPVSLWLDDPASDRGGLRGRFGRVLRHGPISPMTVTIVRPVGDVMASAQVLRSI